MRRFEGASVFITGASSGIGAALARAFAAEGANVALVARRPDRLEQVSRDIEAAGGRALVCACDVADAEGLRAAADTAAEALGGIDVVVANAGFGVSGCLEALTLGDYRRQFEVNFFGVIATIQAVLPHLIRSKGRLGVVGSLAGCFGSPTTSAYNASKAAVMSLTESVYHELDEHGVSVTCINPGFVASEIRSVNNEGKYTGNPDPVPQWLVLPAEKAAADMLRALHRRRPVVFITAHARWLARLNRLSPRLVRWVVRRMTRGKLAKFQAARRNTRPGPPDSA
ncbi:MAG: SDR family oxidoreductase [Candidatus Hydrogenedentes bacterium]|nr:SDR family oxidoreductase [Candidatus Hydrogenedentota bacterium]